MTDEQFTLVLERYKDMVFRVAMNYVKNPADADDITQNVFLKLYRSDTEFETEAHLKHWLIRVALNECKSLFRRGWRRMERIDDYANTLTAPQAADYGLLDAVRSLPEKYRIVLYLYYYEDFSTREIAQIIRSPEATVRTRLRRARKLLSDLLKEEEYGLESAVSGDVF